MSFLKLLFDSLWFCPYSLSAIVYHYFINKGDIDLFCIRLFLLDLPFALNHVSLSNSPSSIYYEPLNIKSMDR